MQNPIPLQDYNINKLIYKETHLSGSIKETLKNYTLEICLVTLALQGTLFLLTTIDFLLGNVPNNSIRLLVHYLFRMFRAIILLCYPSWQQNEPEEEEGVELAPLRRRQSLL